MSFTQDELDAFNAILEERLAMQRRELEQSFDQRMQTLKEDFDQHLVLLQQDIAHRLPVHTSDQQDKNEQNSTATSNGEQASNDQAAEQESPVQQLEDVIERTLAAQLLAIEQLINQRLSPPSSDVNHLYTPVPQSAYEAVEVHTEVSWEDLVTLINNALNERLTRLDASMQAALKRTEQYLASQIHVLRDDLVRRHSYNGSITNVQELFDSIEQLERIIESMQVAMTSNHALLSNRLFFHQHLPLERAHLRADNVSHSQHESSFDQLAPSEEARKGEE